MMEIISHAFLWGSVLSVHNICRLYVAEGTSGALVASDRCVIQPACHIQDQSSSPANRSEARSGPKSE